MRASVDGAREGRAVYRQGRAALPSLRRDDPARAVRATATASPTGARRASREEWVEARRKGREWPSARRTSTRPCAPSAWARSPTSRARSTRAPRFPSPSRATARRAGRRCTSTGRSCASSSRRARTGSPRCPTRVTRSQRAPPRAGRRDLRAGARASPERAIRSSSPSCCPLLEATAEGGGGAAWDDAAFERAYTELERSLFGSRRLYAAVAPVIGVSLGAAADLGGGVRIRPAASGELAAHRPDAASLAPAGFGREPDRLCVLELEQELPEGGAEPPDAPGELADAVTALRLATAGPIAAGPVLFERLDWRPYGIRAGAAGRGDRAARRARPPRRLPRRPRRGAAPARCRSQTTTATSATRSTASSSPCSRTSRSAPSSCASSLESLLGGGRRLLRRRDARRGAPRRERS